MVVLLTQYVELRQPLLDQDVLGYSRHCIVLPLPQNSLWQCGKCFLDRFQLFIGHGRGFDHGTQAEEDHTVWRFVDERLEILKMNKLDLYIYFYGVTVYGTMKVDDYQWHTRAL